MATTTATAARRVDWMKWKARCCTFFYWIEFLPQYPSIEQSMRYYQSNSIGFVKCCVLALLIDRPWPSSSNTAVVIIVDRVYNMLHRTHTQYTHNTHKKSYKKGYACVIVYWWWHWNSSTQLFWFLIRRRNFFFCIFIHKSIINLSVFAYTWEPMVIIL